MLAALLNRGVGSEPFLCKRMKCLAVQAAVVARRLVQLEVARLSFLAFEMSPPVTGRAVHPLIQLVRRGGRGGGGGEEGHLLQLCT